MMKNKLLLAFMTCIGMFFASCSSSDEVNVFGSNKHYMQLDMLGEEYESDKPFPCTVIDFDEWIMVEYTTDGMEHPDVMPYLCVNKVQNQCYLLLGYEDGVVLADFDMLKGTTGENAIIMTTVDGYNKYSLAKIQYENGELSGYEIISETSEKDTDSPHKARRKDYFDDYTSSNIKIICKRLNEFETKVSLWIDASGSAAITMKAAISAMGVGISGVVNAIKFRLSETPGLDERTKHEIQTEIGESIILSLIKRPWRMMYNAEGIAFDKTGLKAIFEDMIDEWNKKINSSQPMQEIPVFSSPRVIDNWYKVKQEITQAPPKYTVSLTLYSVDETTASFGASYDYGYDAQMSYVSSMGLECWSKSTGEKIVTEERISGDMHLTNLHPLTTYLCCAYMNSFGTTYRSKYIEFTTKGELTLYPSEMHFSVEGGSDKVDFSLLRDNISAWDYTAPSWCKIDPYPDWFRVTVGPNKGKTALSGDVNISMVLKSGKKTTAKLKVSQDKPDIEEEEEGGDENYGSGEWNGTYWEFSNNSQFDFTIRINNLANRNAVYGGFLKRNDWAENVTALEKTKEGIYIGKQGSWNEIGVHIVEINVVRTGNNTAKAYLTYRQIPLFGAENKWTATLNGKRK